MKTDFSDGDASFRIKEEAWGYHVLIGDNGIVTRRVVLTLIDELAGYIKKTDRRSVLIESHSMARTSNAFDFVEYTEFFISAVKKKVCFAVVAPDFAATTDKDLLLDIVFNRNVSMQFFQNITEAKTWLIENSKYRTHQ